MIVFFNHNNKKILLLWFLFNQVSLFAQLETSKWLFSGNYNNGLPMEFNFDTLPPSLHVKNRKMNFNMANANISDRAGKLLFYTNGIWVANSTGDTMLNGNRIVQNNLPIGWINNGLPVIQGTLILPFPGDTNKFILFHNSPSYSLPNPTVPYKMFYTLIDMTQDSGKGGVLSKNNILITDTIQIGELTACKHANGRDWWIFIHQFRSNLFYRILLNPQGPIVDGTQSIGTLRDKSGGSICFSPDGKWLAQYSGDTELNFYRFDRCSGQLSNYLHTQFVDHAPLGGVAFSSNSQFLYATSPSSVYQFDLNDSDIVASQQTVAQWDTTYSPSPPFSAGFFLMQLMLDRKIYIVCNNGTKTFHRINYPDSSGLACAVEQHFIQLPAFNLYTIPNYPNYYLGADSGSVCDTLMLALKEPVSVIKSLNVFPNPANDHIKIDFPSNIRNGTMEIIDINGQIVFKDMIRSNPSHTIDVSLFLEGVYLCRITNDQSYSSSKFIITR